MTLKEKIAGIKKLLFDTSTPAAPTAFTPAAPPAVVPVAQAAPPPPPAAPVTVDYTLTDGSKITASTMAVGGDVLVNGQPAPAGTYMIMDGSSVVVDENGKISQVIPAPVVSVDDNTVQDMQTPQQMLAALQNFGSAIDPSVQIILKALMNYCFGYELRRAQEQLDTANAIAAYQSTMTGQVTPLTTDFAALKAQFAKQVEAMQAMVDVVNEISGEPTAVVPEPAKMKFAYLGGTTAQSKADKFAEAHKKYKDSLKATA